MFHLMLSLINTEHLHLLYFSITITQSWEWVGTAGVTNYVVARVGHTMTLINDSFIYVIGGLTAKQGTNLDAQKRQQWNLDWASMQDILVYNTVNGTWESRTATGPAPLPRIYHSATLGMFPFPFSFHCYLAHSLLFPTLFLSR
jgi:hypothetical protein